MKSLDWGSRNEGQRWKIENEEKNEKVARYGEGYERRKESKLKGGATRDPPDPQSPAVQALAGKKERCCKMGDDVVSRAGKRECHRATKKKATPKPVLS